MRRTQNEEPLAVFARRKVRDQYGNTYTLTGELSKGGQGYVYTTDREEYIVKQPKEYVENKAVWESRVDLAEKMDQWETHFQEIRILPFPRRIDSVLTLPVAVLDGEPGYVMRFLSGMKSFASIFELDGETRKALIDENPEMPDWMRGCPDKSKWLYYHYAKTGSTKHRLYALYKCASCLARLHSSGMVYGDISTNNIFIEDKVPGRCSLIDADNIRLEGDAGSNVITPGYGAPEVVQGKDSIRPRTDCWAFAVMAYWMLALQHPFKGKLVFEPQEVDDFGDADEKAYAGQFPYIADPNDDSNAWLGPLPRELIMTEQLQKLFVETFCSGRTMPWRRPSMAIWAKELAVAFDQSLDCPNCGMSYYSELERCPYCDCDQPDHYEIVGPDGWRKVYQQKEGRVSIPYRVMASAFPIESGDEAYSQKEINADKHSLKTVRGEDPCKKMRVIYKGVKNEA